MNEPTMPFGKHRGQPLSKIPYDYLAWILENVESLNPWLRQAITAEMESRLAGNREKKQQQQQGTGNALVSVRKAVDSWWRMICMKYHPDRGGDVKTMQALNDVHDQLEDALKQLKI